VTDAAYEERDDEQKAREQAEQHLRDEQESGQAPPPDNKDADSPPES
jgi:hypothetical protein